MALLPCRRIVVPVDFTRRSWEALKVAADLLAPDGQLVVTYVVPVNDFGDPWTPRRELVDSELRAKLAEHGFAHAETRIAYGDPGTQITQVAEQVMAELIVIPSRGRRGLAHMMLGSVAERVMRLAHCPVLVLHDSS